MTKHSNKMLKRWKLLKYKPECKKIKKSSFSTAEVVTIVIITSFISLLMGLIIANSSYTKEEYKALSNDIQDFLDEYDTLKQNYYGEFDEKEVLDKALETIINELGDPYSGVVDDSLSNSLTTKLQGTYEGLGVEIALNNQNYIQILNVIDDTPASRAGLKVYDIITELNGKNVVGMSTTDFVKLVKEAKDKTINLGILRDGNAMNFDITREKIVLNSVFSEIYEKNNKKIGYIYIDIFAANTGTQFNNELKSLDEKGINSLIIDVRDNTGGHLSSVREIMSNMVDSSKVMYQIEDKKKTTKYYSEGKKSYNKKIVILTNGVSASASEMLTACLKENLNATIIGNKTFGKGTVQEVKQTTSGVDFKLTVSKWLTPNGNWVNGNGIKPDIEITLSDEYYSNPIIENDNQFQKALEVLSK